MHLLVIKEMRSDGSFTYEGYCIDLLNELARILKFAYEIYPSPDGLYGTKTKNGTWNGMIGELVSKVCKYRYVALFVFTSPIIYNKSFDN